jgi:hypothetical protein
LSWLFSKKANYAALGIWALAWLAYLLLYSHYLKLGQWIVICTGITLGLYTIADMTCYTFTKYGRVRRLRERRRKREAGRLG